AHGLQQLRQRPQTRHRMGHRVSPAGAEGAGPRQRLQPRGHPALAGALRRALGTRRAIMVAIRFGLALDFGTRRASLDRVVAEYVPLINLAERYGFESVWAGESYPTAPGGFHLPSPLLVLAALAPQTSVRLGTGVTLVPMWH